MRKITMLLFGILILFSLVLAGSFLSIKGHMETITMLKAENRFLLGQLKGQKLRMQTLLNREFDFEIKEMEVSGYAPLDPDAVEGVCYSGDPNLTASGKQVIPDVSIAMGPKVPFGTWIWIEDLGWRVVEDRGSSIGDKNIDVCFETRDEAIQWGRQIKQAVIPKYRGK